jgi:hypothetical protein
MHNGAPPAPPPALTVRLGDGTKIDFEDLCEPCMSAVKGHLEAVGKKIVGLSPERKKKDELPPSRKDTVDVIAPEQVAKRKGP